MGVIVADNTNASYDGNLSTVNGFYRGEAHNLGFASTTVINLNTTVGAASPIPVTFANAGNQKGLCLSLYIPNPGVQCDYGITILLQEYVASVWTTRTTNAFTIADITANETQRYGTWVNGFKLTTYAVDTTASKWRYLIYKTGGTNGSIQLTTSDATNPFYVAWLDNQVSFVNNDIPVCVDTLIIDQTATFLGTLGTGVTTYSSAGIICRGADLTDPTTLCKMKWEDSPASSYTLTIDGQILCTSGAGFRIGTLASPIPLAQQAIVEFQCPPTNGTTTTSNFIKPGLDTYERPSLFAYGETPSVRIAQLASNANSGQPNIVLDDDSTGWAIGDELAIGKENRTSNPDNANTYVISSISGANITLTGNIGYNRLAGASVFKLNDYGVVFRITSTSTQVGGWVYTRSIFAHLDCQGVAWRNVRIAMSTVGNSGIGAYVTSASFNSDNKIIDCVYSYYLATTTLTHWIALGTPTNRDVYMTDCYCNGLAIGFGQVYGSTVGKVYLDNFVRIGRQNTSVIRTITDGSYNIDSFEITNCRFENCGGMPFTIRNTDLVFENNYLYGSTSGITGIFMEAGGLKNSGASSIKNNTYERMGNPWYLYPGSYIYPSKEIGSTFIDCTYAMLTSSSCVLDMEFENCTYSGTEPSFVLSTTAVNGSKIRVTNWNNTGETFVKNVYGETKKTGDGLTDTTVRTSGTGKFALRFEPTSSTNNLTWDFTIPTGDISTKTMTIGVWCKINSATYYAGTHQLPRLTIDYDNGTTAYHQAGETTDWQLLFVSFTPTTTYGQVTVTLSGRTDATTTNAYIYWDDFTVAYPPSVALDLGGLDNWASGLPVVPPLSLPISAGTVAQQVWQQLTTTSWGTNSLGEYLKTLTPSERIKFIDDGEIPIY